MIRFRCPDCDAMMEVDESFAGRPARCSTCGAELRVPKAEEAQAGVAPPAETPAGVARVKVGGQTVEIHPPLDMLAVTSLAVLGMAIIAAVAINLMIPSPIVIAAGMGLGAVLALLAGLVGLSSYFNVRHSKGRRRGKVLAMVGMFGGAAACIALGALTLAQWYRISNWPDCDENLKHIYAAMEVYAEDHDGELPEHLTDLYANRYLERPEYLICPTTLYTHYGHTSYQKINGPEGAPAIDLDRDDLFPPDLPIVRDGPRAEHEDGKIRVLLLGGDVKAVSETEWSRMAAKLNQQWSNIVETTRRPKKPDAD